MRMRSNVTYARTYNVNNDGAKHDVEDECAMCAANAPSASVCPRVNITCCVLVHFLVLPRAQYPIQFAPGCRCCCLATRCRFVVADALYASRPVHAGCWYRNIVMYDMYDAKPARAHQRTQPVARDCYARVLLYRRCQMTVSYIQNALFLSRAHRIKQ